jgi:membrane fusion protein, heavy metal efflux system
MNTPSKRLLAMSKNPNFRCFFATSLLSAVIAGLFPAVAGAQVGCLIEPSQSSEVSALTSGVITDIKADRGARVKRGQVLAYLTSDVEKANLGAAKQRAASEADIDAAAANRDLAKLKLRKTHELMNLGQSTQFEIDQAKMEHEVADHRVQHSKDMLLNARKEVRVAQSQLEQRLIRSPIDGVVAERSLNVGERADGKSVFKVINLQKLKAEVILPAAQFGSVREGQSMKVMPDIAGGQAVLGQVTQVDSFLDAASGTFRARLAINNADRKIPAGVKCKIEVDNSQPAPAVVPAPAKTPGQKPANTSKANTKKGTKTASRLTRAG